MALLNSSTKAGNLRHVYEINSCGTLSCGTLAGRSLELEVIAKKKIRKLSRSETSRRA
jgi:hypothetical protein